MSMCGGREVGDKAKNRGRETEKGRRVRILWIVR